MKLLIGWLLGVMMTGLGCVLFSECGCPARRRAGEPRRSRLYVEDLRREEGWM